jgi:hypothetical protein
MAGSLTIIVPDVSLIVQCFKARQLRHQFHAKVKLMSNKKQLIVANSEPRLEDIEYMYCSELQICVVFFLLSNRKSNTPLTNA